MTKATFVLDGWSNDDGTTLWDFVNDMISADMTLTAIWSPAPPGPGTGSGTGSGTGNATVIPPKDDPTHPEIPPPGPEPPIDGLEPPTITEPDKDYLFAGIILICLAVAGSFLFVRAWKKRGG